MLHRTSLKSDPEELFLSCQLDMRLIMLIISERQPSSLDQHPKPHFAHQNWPIKLVTLIPHFDDYYLNKRLVLISYMRNQSLSCQVAHLSFTLLPLKTEFNTLHFINSTTQWFCPIFVTQSISLISTHFFRLSLAYPIFLPRKTSPSEIDFLFKCSENCHK